MDRIAFNRTFLRKLLRSWQLWILLLPALIWVAVFCYGPMYGLLIALGQFTRDYTQTVKRAADNKRRYAPGRVA